ncbi:hypothetical protein HII31_03410 [Pseudocercospora fuligena]|uniref:Uncharacterized protein n=1 Tax=Pseudocercospora fuligena TaxID=685502 RepID=A0A8H6RPL9_9PEZI|nr:hypothetical protein HII31_03410 [Pseudocercospora fuligena]
MPCNGLPLFASPLNPGGFSRHSSQGSGHGYRKRRHEHTGSSSSDSSGEPAFRRYSEATNAELFYDLWFIANLTVFTNVHEANDHRTLAQYVGFFCLLWEVSLYDIRFSMDSVFERIAKTCHFGTMLGFAIVGVNFNVGEKPGKTIDGDLHYTSFRALTLVMMADRLILVAQYIQTIWFSRKYRRAAIPLIYIVATYWTAAMVYLGLFFTFYHGRKDENHTYLTWYAIAITETAVVTFISSKWRIISFKHTHLVQRMSLLTLIILGEGIMGLAKACQKISKISIFHFWPSVIGAIICAVLILYFIYMLYFDWVEEEHFGSIREQVWSFMHFPLHLFLVLAVEGVAQAVAWRTATVKGNQIMREFETFDFGNETLWTNASPDIWQIAARTANNTANEVFYSAITKADSYAATVIATQRLDIAYNATAIIASGGNATNAAIAAAEWTYFTLFLTVYEIAGFQPRSNDTRLQSSLDATIDFSSDVSIDEALTEWQRDLDKTYRVFRLVFIYLLVSIGAVAMMCVLLAVFSKRHKTFVHQLRLVTTAFVGVGLTLLSTIVVTSDDPENGVFIHYSSGPWLLPTITWALFLIVVLNSVRWPFGSREERLPVLP